MNNLINILGFMDTINDLDEKLYSFLEKYTSNVGFGTLILAVILVVSYWAIGYLNKK